MSEAAEFVSAFLSRHLRGGRLGEDENIFELGFVTSLLAMQLVTLLEKRFNIEFKDDDLTRENFQSISAISTLVGRRLDDKTTAGAAS